MCSKTTKEAREDAEQGAKASGRTALHFKCSGRPWGIWGYHLLPSVFIFLVGEQRQEVEAGGLGHSPIKICWWLE